MAHLHELRDMDSHYIIDSSMNINKASGEEKTLNLGDHNSEVFTFEMPKIIEGHDMSLCNKVEVHFINAGTIKKSEDYYTVHELDEAEQDKLIFTWVINGSGTLYSGGLSFRILFACVDENGKIVYKKWTSVHSGTTVNDGFDNTEVAQEQQSAFVAEWEMRMNALEEGGSDGKSAYELAVENGGHTYSTQSIDMREKELPQASAEDTGKFLRVSQNGEIVFESLETWTGGSY